MDELLEIGFRIRKFVIISIGTFYRSVCDHPFVVGMVFFLIFLYRSFPFAFSLLVSASPVLICTAALLGTLLSFGHPNIPEIDEEEKTTDEIVPLKIGVSKDATVVERDESYSVERYTERRRDVVEKPIEEASWTLNKINDVDSPLLAEENLSQERVIEETERGFCDSGFDKKIEMKEEKLSDGEVVVNQYSRVETVVDENLELGNDKLAGNSFDSHWVDNLEFPPLKQVVEEEDDEASESGSDLAESSSPDASITDIIPMLDELHPLLDEDAPQPAHVSHDAASECSLKSSEDSENHEDLGVGEEDDDDDDEEEEAQGDKENATKSAITWTEDDQKNLMDLGTSELERNQRLESLIARRRARKNLRMMAEKNLIDLDDADLPFDIAPISTRRHNPFDLPYDSYDNMGLPPIPGSAPSILLPRRNPFDLPYDSSEEKPDLMGDSFQQEYMTFLPKESSFFRRHESFNVGPSFFGSSKQERQDIHLRPYFIPERMASEGTSHSSFQRQSSELSDSKVSSVPETESMGSAGELEDKKFIEEDFSREAELISSIEDACEHIGHGSQSSEDVETVELGSQVEKRDVELDETEINLGDVENQQEMESSLSETGSLANPVESNANEIHLNAEAVKQKHSSRSSSSSFSEVREKIFTEEEEGEELSRLEARGEPGISTQHLLEESDLDITSVSVDYTQNKEPVYDSSPSALEKNLSSSSISSDLHVEVSEMCLPPVVVKRTISFTERESGVSNEGMETPTNEEMLEDSSQLHEVDVTELRSTEISEHDVMKIGISGVEENPDGANASNVSQYVANNYLIEQKPSSGTSVEKDLMYRDHSNQHTEGQFPSLSFNADIHVAIHQDAGEKVESTASHYQLKSSEDQILAAQQEAQLSLNAEQVLHTSSFESESKEVHLVNKEVAAEFDPDHVHPLNSNANFHVSVHQEADNKLVSLDYQRVSEEKPMTEPEEVLLLLGKSVDISSSVKHDELKEKSIIQAETEEVSIANNLNISEVQNLDNKVSPNASSPSSPEPTTIPTEVYETRAQLPDLKDSIIDEVKNDDQIRHSEEHYNFSPEATYSDVHVQNAIEDTDEIKEIDEGLLLELDTVGDFSVIAEPLSLKTEVDLGESEIPHQGPIKVETESAMPVLEARSLEDIDTAFKQVSENEIEKPIAVESLDADMIQEETMAGSSEFVALLQGSNLTETNLELPVLGARSIEDIDSTFKQLQHGNVERDILPGPVGESPNKAVSIDLTETPSQLHVVETRTPEDTDTALKHVSESNIENLVKLDSEDRSAKVEANKVGVSKDTGGIIEESRKQETSTGVAEKPDHEVESSDDISSIISDVKGKKENSNKLRSSSTSSSSSSSSSSLSGSDIE